MKINIRPLKAEAFDVEAEPSDTVEALKGKVSALRPELPAGQLKMVYEGKVLKDDVTLQDCGVTEGSFLVVMVAKPKPVAGSEPAAAPSASAAPAAAPAPAPAPTPAPAPAAAPAPVAAAGAAGGPALEATIQMMCDMGFPRSMVEQCLRAAFNNPDRAVEYLMSGIPPHLQALASGQAPPAPAPAPAQAPGAAPGGGQAQMPGFPMMPMAPVGNATGPLAKLQNHPLFFRLKAAVQQNPGALNQVLSVIEKADPSMIPLIAEHQEEFVAILAEPAVPQAGPGAVPAFGAAGAPAAPGAPQDPVAAMIAAMQAAQQGGAAPNPAAPGAAAPAAGAPAPAAPAAAPQLSEQEQQAIERLQALGFDRAMATQAYLACERNEELAANYLFEMGEEN